VYENRGLQRSQWPRQHHAPLTTCPCQPYHRGLSCPGVMTTRSEVDAACTGHLAVLPVLAAVAGSQPESWLYCKRQQLCHLHLHCRCHCRLTGHLLKQLDVSCLEVIFVQATFTLYLVDKRSRLQKPHCVCNGHSFYLLSSPMNSQKISSQTDTSQSLQHMSHAQAAPALHF